MGHRQPTICSITSTILTSITILTSVTILTSITILPSIIITILASITTTTLTPITRFYDNNTGSLVHSMVAHLDSVTSLAVDQHGLYLISGSHDCSIRWPQHQHTRTTQPAPALHLVHP